MANKKPSGSSKPNKKNQSIRFQWDEGNLNKLKLIQGSGRDFSVDELESVFLDPYYFLKETYADPNTGESRYLIVGTSNENQIISVVFVFRGIMNDQIRIFNCWKTKRSVLKNYHEQKAIRQSEEGIYPEAESPN